jgi:YVTN family beta-propeller protein
MQCGKRFVILIDTKVLEVTATIPLDAYPRQIVILE